MSRDRRIDFSDDFSRISQDLSNINKDIEMQRKNSEQISNQIKELANQLKELGINIESESSSDQIKQGINVLSDDYLNKLSESIEKDCLKEINSNINMLPSLSKLDYLIGFFVGLIAAVVDFLLVKIPQDINYLGNFKQDGSNITSWFKSLGIDDDGHLNHFFSKMEEWCKVSYDASTTNAFGEYNQDVNGFYPKTHRMMSLGHDPFYGLIFSLIDMFNGSITLIDARGVIHHVALEKFQNPTIGGMVFAPFLYLGHLLSDLCTKMGIPIPGWAFTQLLHFGKFGEKERSVADLTRWMYLEGYDLRHFVSMSIVPSIIELLTRIYNKFTVDDAEFLSLQYEKDLMEIQYKIRLHKLLFIAHSVATSGNAIKIAMYHGNPLALNLAEILAFTKESIQFGQILLRDKTPEKIIRNRDNIDKWWESNNE
jgi:hypothetical protein